MGSTLDNRPEASENLVIVRIPHNMHKTSSSMHHHPVMVTSDPTTRSQHPTPRRHNIVLLTSANRPTEDGNTNLQNYHLTVINARSSPRCRPQKQNLDSAVTQPSIAKLTQTWFVRGVSVTHPNELCSKFRGGGGDGGGGNDNQTVQPATSAHHADGEGGSACPVSGLAQARPPCST